MRKYAFGNEGSSAIALFESATASAKNKKTLTTNFYNPFPKHYASTQITNHKYPKKETHGKWRKQQERDSAADKPIRAKEYSTSNKQFINLKEFNFSRMKGLTE